MTKLKKRKYSITFTQPSLTKQSFKDECNINHIMSKYEKTGSIEHVNNHQGSYGDFTHSQSYQESLNQIMLAQNQFDSLPAQIRKQFENDPILFVEYCSNPDNHDNLVKMGLAQAEAIIPGDDEVEPPNPIKEDKTPPAAKEKPSEDT